jgi:hypothetical protein
MLLQKIGQGTEVNQVNINTYQQAILMLQKIEAESVSQFN